MNKIENFVLLMIFSLVINYTINGQESEEMIFGVKAGVNLSTLNGQDAYLPIGGNLLDATTKLNAVFGVTTEYPFSIDFSIQPELLLSMKGVNFDANEYIQSWSLWYLELPILFKSIFEMDNDVLGSFYAGPAVSYILKSTWSEKNLYNYIHEDEEMIGIKNIDFSAIVGASFDMPLLSSRVGIDLRYTYGLINIQENTRRQNGAISISLYYLVGAIAL